MKVIAHIENDLKTKFGVPRQSGLAKALESRIVFEPEYRNAEALRGLEGFSHIWLLWDFSESHRDGWSPTVRPPRLGGNRRVGVFASRSPFRPNPIGLSAVKIKRLELSSPRGPVICVEGADLMNGTPILDIKPYLPFADSIPEARGGYTDETHKQEPLEVVGLEQLSNCLTPTQLQALQQILSSDPRPHYQSDPERVYCIEYAGREILFRVEEKVVKISPDRLAKTKDEWQKSSDLSL